MTANESDSAAMDGEVEPDETAAGTSYGAGDAETDFVPPTAVAEVEHAWSNEEPATEVLSRSWRSVWAIAGIGLVCAAIAAFAIFGATALIRDHVIRKPSAASTHSASASAPVAPAAQGPAPQAPNMPRAARPDDDEFVAVAISPTALGSERHGGFGTSGTQDRANQIALSECRADSGNEDCLLVNAGIFHGCISYAIDSSRRNWSSGSGSDPVAARASALGRLGSPATITYVQCSDPPGIVRSSESSAAQAAPPPVAPPPAARVPTASELDERYLAALTSSGIRIADVPAALAGAHAVCRYLAAGHSEADAEALALRNNPSLTTGNAETMVVSAVQVYCPQQGG